MNGDPLYTKQEKHALKYRDGYYAYRTLDGPKFYFESVDDKDIFDQNIQNAANKVGNLTMKALTKDGIKSFNYNPKTRVIDLKDTFVFAKPRSEEYPTMPEEYIAKEEYSQIWLVPFMYPFMRFKYPIVQDEEKWGTYKAQET